MNSDSIDPSFTEGPNIQEFSQNDILFRAPVVDLEKYASLRRAQLKHFPRKLDYQLFVSGLTPVVFLDLWDVLKFLNVKRQVGYDPISIQEIANIVCDHIGDDSSLHELVWTSVDEEVADTIVAELGITEHNECMEHNVLLSHPFGDAMQVVIAIAELIKSYLVNAGFPIIESESVYKVGDYKNGIIALQLRTYEELISEYGEVDEDEEENGDF
jgi:hypothetical protein